MSWQKIVSALFQVLAEQLGGFAGAGLLWLLEQLKKMGVLADAGSIEFSTHAGVDAAPDAFKQAVREFLQGLVSKINRPLIRLLVARVIDSLSDAVLDALWDRLFGAARVGATTDVEAAVFADEFAAA